jgi:hypothetical protein|tara:strand:- start:2172 stop:2288 length:117 start_codon:yes stop_codon:yes gene_type:complete
MHFANSSTNPSGAPDKSHALGPGAGSDDDAFAFAFVAS